jgi:hypothetical protein
VSAYLAEKIAPVDADELGRLAREYAVGTGDRTLANRLDPIIDARARREGWRIHDAGVGGRPAPVAGSSPGAPSTESGRTTDEALCIMG